MASLRFECRSIIEAGPLRIFDKCAAHQLRSSCLLLDSVLRSIACLRAMVCRRRSSQRAQCDPIADITPTALHAYIPSQCVPSSGLDACLVAHPCTSPAGSTAKLPMSQSCCWPPALAPAPRPSAALNCCCAPRKSNPSCSPEHPASRRKLVRLCPAMRIITTLLLCSTSAAVTYSYMQPMLVRNRHDKPS